ncbi:MAG: thiamine phosphate synthase [Candidatus Omnitrophota bacterium]
MRNIKGFYFITGGDISRRGDLSDVRSAIAAGVTVVQYRDKRADSAAMYRKAQALKRLCKRALFLVNDRIDLALAVNADGVHLGQDDLSPAVARKLLGKKKIIGVSVSTMEQAARAVRGGADYLGVGPIYATSTKTDAHRPVGVDIISKIKARFNIPVIVIGGISPDNAPKVIAAGADALCAISAVVTKNDVRRRIGEFQALFGARR